MRTARENQPKINLLNYVLGSISALAGILFVVIMAVQLILVQPAFLNGTNAKYNIASQLSMKNEELEKVVDVMISYVKGKTTDAQIVVEIDGRQTEFFNEKEIVHLSDVQEVLKLINKIEMILALVCVFGVLFLIWKKRTKAVVIGIFVSWIILLLTSVAVGIIAAIDINKIIYGFHELFFTNDLWLLDPAVDRSIWLFGNSMYMDAIMRIGAIVGVVCIFTNGVAAFIYQKIKKNSLL